MKLEFIKSKSGVGWFAYDNKGNLIDYYFTKLGAVRAAKRKIKNPKTRKRFTVEI